MKLGVMGDQNQIKVERVGGFAGFGGPHLKSRGELATTELSPADSAALDTLFQENVHAGAANPDGFIYRITRNEQTIEVPEHKVPEAVKNSVKDTLE
ncbi:MAG TPA: protealysin inhibitor emfourin [Pyrinomonadaceae bacterium]|nr:protealysin inhibitor emfourin [Pyrinomonadaceae bacterium]